MSGLVLAIAGKVYASWAATGWATSVWLVLPAIVAAGGTAFAVTRYRHHPGRRQVFLLVSAFVQKHWVAELLENLIRALDRHGVDLVLKIPPHEYGGHGQLQQLAELRRNSRSFLGGFVMAADCAANHVEFDRFCRSLRIPIVFIGSSPFEHVRDYPPNAALVGCDDTEIGTRSAEWVAKILKDRELPYPNVLVVASTEHPDRQNSFAARLRTEVASAEITINDQGRFDRGRSARIVGQTLEEAHRKGVTVHVVFCTNDEMALGAVDAVQERAAAGEGVGDLVIVGVDGTREAIATIDTGGTRFRSTVVQESGRVAEIAVSTLLKLRAYGPVDVETSIPTTIYPLGNASTAVSGSGGTRQSTAPPIPGTRGG
ncbi:substrate-binding domain-containing protein [Micromonospora sp. NBC_01699]|uniref:substrate-binding domain-containing protein n=1 Tax=Micromonospora sp. NBC_01699 TaxID=2975984 RepID=UPI002E373DCD|nr:substrate-binding domain-containing protein [Micromonospora sp. NBC_01699]